MAKALQMFGMLSVRWDLPYLIFWVLRKILHSGWALICLYWRVIILCNTTQYRFELEPDNTTFSSVTRSVTFCHQVVNRLPIWNCSIAFYFPCTIDKLQSCLLQLENISFQRPTEDFQCQLYQIMPKVSLATSLIAIFNWPSSIFHQNHNTRACWKERKWRSSTQVL